MAERWVGSCRRDRSRFRCRSFHAITSSSKYGITSPTDGGGSRCGIAFSGASVARTRARGAIDSGAVCTAVREVDKNDYCDAEAIAEAVERENMRFVPIKTEDQLDLQALHRVRERLVSRRTSVINQIRAFLLEREISFRKGRTFSQTAIVPTYSSCSSAADHTYYKSYPGSAPLRRTDGMVFKLTDLLAGWSKQLMANSWFVYLRNGPTKLITRVTCRALLSMLTSLSTSTLGSFLCVLVGAG